MTKTNENKLVLIKRSAPACPACITMQFALENANIPFDTIDITEKPEAIEEYNLASVPVILIDGVRLNGIQPIEIIKEFLED